MSRTMERCLMFMLTGGTSRPVAKRLRRGRGVACAALLLAAAGARAATEVDIYQDMTEGADGDLLTSALMNASAHPGTFGWGFTGGPWYVSSKNARRLPGPVTVGGVTYDGTRGTHSWMLNNSNSMNYVSVYLGKGGPYTAITVAFYYTTGRQPLPRNYVIYDTVTVLGRDHTFACMQTINQGENGPYGKGPYLRAHSKDEHAKTTYSPNTTPIVAGKTYWINLNYSAAGKGTVSLATFDPDKGFAQVGPTLVAPSCPDKVAWNVMLGRTDNHGNEPNDLAQSSFSHILVDFTHAAFPLVPTNSVQSVVH